MPAARTSRKAGGSHESKCLDRFAYNPNDPIINWANLNPAGSICGGPENSYPVGDVELTLFDSWTVDVMRISCVDTKKHLIYLTGPPRATQAYLTCSGPCSGIAIIIENSKDAFDPAQAAGQTGLWFLDRSTLPGLELSRRQEREPEHRYRRHRHSYSRAAIEGSLLTATDLKYVTFRGITFEVDNFVPRHKGSITTSMARLRFPKPSIAKAARM